jgi:hypothetical protein
MTSLPGCAHDLANKTLRLGRATATVPDPTGTNAEVALVPAHVDLGEMLTRPTALVLLI